MDWQVVLFTFGICVVACLAFGLLPALHTTRMAIPLGAIDPASTKPARLPLRSILLACVGVFGVFDYAVEERRREIGVRLALGARRHIGRMLLGTSGRAIALGLGAGLLLSLACGPVLRSYLFGFSPLDRAAYALVCTILLAAGVAATLIPARRACRVDPAVTLRDE